MEVSSSLLLLSEASVLLCLPSCLPESCTGGVHLSARLLGPPPGGQACAANSLLRSGGAGLINSAFQLAAAYT